jgi:hypothetical protein
MKIRTHPEVLFCYSNHHLELIMKVENKGKHHVWAEAEIKVPDNISLSPDTELRRGRVRIGIVSENEFLEKSVRIFANKYTPPQMYPVRVILYTFNKDGVIESRIEKKANIRCEKKKEESI